jgi:hypothetical protein
MQSDRRKVRDTHRVRRTRNAAFTVSLRLHILRSAPLAACLATSSTRGRVVVVGLKSNRIKSSQDEARVNNPASTLSSIPIYIYMCFLQQDDNEELE